MLVFRAVLSLLVATFTVSVAPAAVVTLFDNPAFVDSENATESESDNLQAGLLSLGHAVVLFTNVPTALSTNTLLLFPEFERGDLAATLSGAQRAALSNFVVGGGAMIVHGAFEDPARSTAFFRVFGLNLSFTRLNLGTSSTQTSLAIGTPFASAPPTIPNNNGSLGVPSAELPANARSLYRDGTLTTVATIPRGSGEIIFLGWDWYDGRPVGSQDGGWLAVLNAAVMMAGSNQPPSPPIIFDQPISRTVFAGGTARFSVTAFGAEPLSYQWTFNNDPIAGETNAQLVLTSVTTNQAGRYAAIISNRVGVANSAKATLVVIDNPGEVFRIDGLFADNSDIVEHFSLSGGDRGGIAVSDTRVFYTGDDGTAVYDLQLTAGQRVNGYSLPVSDLQTGTLYALSDGTNLFPSGSITSLAELDKTSQPTGTIIPLSMPVPFFGGGVFAGYGRIVLHNGTDVFNIQLPGGDVIHLGEMSLPQHVPCEHNAIWGVAEYFDGAIHLACVQDVQTIARTRVPDGDTTVISTFDYLSDMCSFTVAPTLDRWYFHHEGASQFGGIDQVLGYADAAFVIPSLPPSPPVIRQQPRDAGAFVGGTVTFSVLATGTPPLHYQWLLNGAPIAGANTNVLTLSGLTTNQAGLYAVIVSNVLGSVTSSNASLTLSLGGEPFFITSLTSSNSFVIDHNDLTGDDRGGIVASSSHVFYSGDGATARFLLEDLSDAAAITTYLEAPVSDLRTEIMYLLGDGATPVGFGGNVTTLIELNGQTGTPTGARITLSRPISLQGATGIFAGYGRIVIHNGERVYNIEMPSGLVFDLGAMPSPEHFGCEHWAHWGVAEFINGSVHLVYVQHSQAIVRTRVPDGTTTTLASFDNLSDMCSLTVSPHYGRWYFHHEGSSQFGGLNETLGFADATFSVVVSPRPPTILRQPSNMAAVEGGDVTFDVGAFGGALTYQWLFNGSPLAGATNRQLTISGVSSNNLGTYAVIVSNPVGIVLSSNATLTIAPPAGPFRIASLTSSNSRVVEHDIHTGDDRGGIAASATHVLYSGDSATARFNIGDLSGGSGIGRLHNLIVGELASRTLYVLGNGSIPLPGGGVVNSLLQIDGSTGVLTGQRINLSQSISLFSSAGLYSGHRRIVIHDGARVYDVHMPTGVVMDRGAMALPLRSPCEHFAHWGVAEFFNNALHLAYIRDSRTIMRSRVPDGLTNTIATFSNLGDMCSFTVAIPLNRWYFHYEGSSQFGSGSELIGYATASFDFPNSPPQLSAFTNTTIPEDAQLSIPFRVFDFETSPDQLTFLTASSNTNLVPRANIAITGTGTNRTLTVTPALNRSGNASITVNVQDGAGGSTIRSFFLVVTAVNDAPEAVPQSLALDENTSIVITLQAFDAEGTPVTYNIPAPPQHGVLSGTPPNVVYTPTANYSGPDSFTFTASDGLLTSANATVSITVRAVNTPPIAIAQAWAPSATATNGTNLIVLSLDSVSAEVVLDGSLSSDEDGDPLQFSWFELGETNAFAFGPLTTNSLAVGPHQVLLKVYDGTTFATAILDIEVITAVDAVTEMLLLVDASDIGRRNKRPMVATLKAVIASLDEGHLQPALNQLHAFQNKIAAQVAPFDPQLAAELTELAQQLIDAYNAP